MLELEGAGSDSKAEGERKCQSRGDTMDNLAKLEIGNKESWRMFEMECKDSL